MKYYIYANKLDNGNIELGASTVDEKRQIPLKLVDRAAATYQVIEFRLNHLIGKLLTLVDASFPEARQNKALKDIIRNHFAEEFGFFADLLEKGVITETLKEIENMSDEKFAEWLKENPPVELSEVIAPGQ